MRANEIQSEIFRQAKNKLLANQSLAETIAGLLGISTDSAYRRIRGEKPIALDELQLVCAHFNISLDSLLQIQNDAFLFFGKNIDHLNFRFDEYMTGILKHLLWCNSLTQRKFYHESKDIPLFHHYISIEMAAFKYFFWMKTILQFPEYKTKGFSMEDYPAENFEIGKKILKEYVKLPSVEIWNPECISSTIWQIEYFRQMNCFRSSAEVLMLYQRLEEEVSILEKMAAEGRKFNVYGDEDIEGGSFELYHNEVILGHNTMLLQSDKSSAVFLNHSVMNYVMTTDPRFCEYIGHEIHNLMRRSTCISRESEKERNSFFKKMRDKIQSRIDAIRR
jgi:hypothetical protein